MFKSFIFSINDLLALKMNCYNVSVTFSEFWLNNSWWSSTTIELVFDGSWFDLKLDLAFIFHCFGNAFLYRSSMSNDVKRLLKYCVSAFDSSRCQAQWSYLIHNLCFADSDAVEFAVWGTGSPQQAFCNVPFSAFNYAWHFGFEKSVGRRAVVRQRIWGSEKG